MKISNPPQGTELDLACHKDFFAGIIEREEKTISLNCFGMHILNIVEFQYFWSAWGHHSSYCYDLDCSFNNRICLLWLSRWDFTFISFYQGFVFDLSPPLQVWREMKICSSCWSAGSWSRFARVLGRRTASSNCRKTAKHFGMSPTKHSGETRPVSVNSGWVSVRVCSRNSCFVGGYERISYE